ncbi:type I-MYXAN CRISPR-associated Cas8a1/Cmx1 [Nostocaceae cyanobacterium CENA369]|uniref:Type I-MYXAN CRISPR-associated Cas8a1/Cmx1 n=1 Tax=Dendronalium phyllosphericum CENA369 TaxID=1725256 RepID=A0A8J7LHN0_9NOST|nr:type I-MYXAN CRISPR-associated Cas8a1/Cmx1 [Dendronalium phyllosphericum]MBH8578272.1 type I-MYXAN CRISPR-associated Cas8a1/Cmx1 [Dendronalium phyllosphericum CENA369]
MINTTSNSKIQLNLSNSSTTLLHRAGIAGFWMTLKQLEQIYPNPAQRTGNLTWVLTPHSISLNWEGQDFAALDWLLKQSFQISDEGLISLTGLNPQASHIERKIIIHQGITGTFLQHNKFFKFSDKKLKSIIVDGRKFVTEYKSAMSYAHQHFAKKLCDESGQLLQESIGIVGWLYPGAVVRHSAFPKQTKFEEKPEYALALLFVPVACHYFILRSHTKPQSTNYILVVPEVNNLELYAQHCWNLSNLSYRDFHVSSLRDAGLKFLTNEAAIQIKQNCVKRCQVFSFGTLIWSEQQKVRTETATLELTEKMSFYYKLSRSCFSNYRIIDYENQHFILTSLVQGIIANNLGLGLPWWNDFGNILTSSNLFNQIADENQGIYMMIQESEWDIESQKLFIKACHEALKVIYAKIYARTKENEYAQIERENTKIISQLGRCTNAENFRKFIAEFWGKAGQLSILEEHWEELLPITTGMMNWKMARDLTFIAIASYPKSKNIKTESSEISQTIRE